MEGGLADGRRAQRSGVARLALLGRLDVLQIEGRLAVRVALGGRVEAVGVELVGQLAAAPVLQVDLDQGGEPEDTLRDPG